MTPAGRLPDAVIVVVVAPRSSSLHEDIHSSTRLRRLFLEAESCESLFEGNVLYTAAFDLLEYFCYHCVYAVVFGLVVC